MKKFLTTILCILLVLAALNTLTGCDGTKDYSKIDNAIAATNAQVRFPVEQNEYIKWTSFNREGLYVIWRYEFDDEVIDPEGLRSNIESGKEQVKATLKVDPIGDLAKKAGLGLKMIYMGENSGETVELVLENNEL